MRTMMAMTLVFALALTACGTENLQGDAGMRGSVCGKPSHQYSDFDRDNRVLEFLEVSSGATITVAVDPSGRGELHSGGVAYGIQVDDINAEEPIILIDTTRSGWLDKRVQRDGYFILPSCY